MCLSDTTIAVLCGGLATRVAPVLGNTPKCLAPINGRPYLDWLIDKIKSQGGRRIILCAGHLGFRVEEWLALRPQYASIVEICIEKTQEGTSQAIRNIRHRLTSDYVMVMNGDTIIDADLCRFHRLIAGSSLPAGTLFAEPTGTKMRSSSGVHLMTQAVLDDLMTVTAPQFHQFMHKHARGAAEVTLWRARYHDIGNSPQRLAQAGEFLDSMACATADAAA